jgi:hypothetical protein
MVVAWWIDGVNPIYYDIIKVCDPGHFTYFARSIDFNEGAVHIPQSVGIASGRPSASYYFVGSQADNLFHFDPHHTRTAIPLRPPKQTTERERIPIRRATPERGSVLPAITVRRRLPRPVAQAYRLSCTQLPRRHPYQNNCQQAATPWEVHTSLELRRRQWSRVGTVGLGWRRQLGSYPGALRGIAQRCRAVNVLRRVRAQGAALGTQSEHGHYVLVQDRSGLDRSSAQCSRGTRC